MINCNECGREYPPVTIWPIHCCCTNRIREDGTQLGKRVLKSPRPKDEKAVPVGDKRAAAKYPCTNRGDVVRMSDCGCDGNRRVYACGIGGECMIRQLPRSTFAGRFCETCSDRRDDG
jgi:hypothetical protein